MNKFELRQNHLALADLGYAYAVAINIRQKLSNDDVNDQVTYKVTYKGHKMFKHILLATDGSRASEIAIQKTIELAKSINAEVSGISVSPEYHVFTYQMEMLATNKEAYMKESKEHVERYLAVIEDAAKAAGVPCDTLYVINDHPHEAIIQIAEEKRCDLIAMASHGRKGLQNLLIGSETQKVLANSKIPVLVFR